MTGRITVYKILLENEIEKRRNETNDGVEWFDSVQDEYTVKTLRDVLRLVRRVER